MTAWRCSSSSETRHESLVGTASTVQAFVLIELSGPWGPRGLLDSRLPADIARELHHRCREHVVRALLIRRHGRRPAPSGITVFTAYADPVRPWAETTVLTEERSLLDLDLAALGDGRSPGLTAHTEPLFLVCTHGRHDVCCAERGRPVAAALSLGFPANTWEVSHIGGDRFAGNVLVLPAGLYYGRLAAVDGTDFGTAHLEGRLDLDRLRGRCGYPFVVQAAEIFLRQHLADDVNGSVALVSAARTPGAATVLFDRGLTRWSVTVDISRAAPEQLTCRGTHLDPAPRFALSAVTRA